jgi:hypothetical protein
MLRKAGSGRTPKTFTLRTPRITRNADGSCGQFAEKFLLVHAVLEGFAAVDEDHGDFIVIEPADLGVGIHVDFVPGEAASFVEFDEALLDDFAEMTSLPGIDNNLPRLRHAGECSSFGAGCQDERDEDERDE